MKNLQTFVCIIPPVIQLQLHYEKKPSGAQGAIHDNTGGKIRFTVNLILIKGEAKYDQGFDPNFEARQMCIKYGHIVRLLFKRPNKLRLRIFPVLTIK